MFTIFFESDRSMSVLVPQDVWTLSGGRTAMERYVRVTRRTGGALRPEAMDPDGMQSGSGTPFCFSCEMHFGYQENVSLDIEN
jgi:hypothetical protein